MTIGVTTASAERSFSFLWRIKSHLRSTMSEDKLWNNLEDVVIKFAHTHQIPETFCINSYIFKRIFSKPPIIQKSHLIRWLVCAFWAKEMPKMRQKVGVAKITTRFACHFPAQLAPHSCRRL